MKPFDEAWTVLKELPRFDVEYIENWSPHPLNFYTQGQTVGGPGEADLTVPSICKIIVN